MIFVGVPVACSTGGVFGLMAGLPIKIKDSLYDKNQSLNFLMKPCKIIDNDSIKASGKQLRRSESMSEKNTEHSDNSENGEGDTVTVEDLQNQLDSMTKERDSVKKNRDDILAEKKKNGLEKREAEEQVLKTRAEKALKDKDFDDYRKSHDELTAKREKEFSAERAEFNNSKISTEALQISARLAEGHNVELLSDIMRQRIRFENGAMVVLDASGNVTAHTLKDLENEFTNSPKYASLLKGRKSSGGGANGGSGGASGDAETVTRAEFDALSQVDRSKFSMAGGKVIDE